MIPDDLSIPACLRRDLTPENAAARLRLVEQDRNRAAGGRQRRRRKLSDEQATELRIEDEARRRWHSWIPTIEERHRPRLATFERRVREEFKAKVERRLAVTESLTEAAPAVATEESVVAKVGKKEQALRAARGTKKPPKAKKAVAVVPVEKPSGVRPGSKVELVAQLLQRPEGCTTADVLKATGWPSVSMPQQAKAAGLKLRKEKDGGVSRYYGEAA